MSKYLIPMILVVYGILLLKGVHLPKIRGSGEGWILAGFSIIIAGLIFEYYDSKNSKQTEEEKLTILDIFCMFLFWSGVTFMGLYLFGINQNNYLMIVAVFLTMYCGGTRAKKFTNHNSKAD